uniref:Lophotrochin n=1 Tax=Platynereis dumerilii TaxID=6359 RepID=A0A6M3Z5I2_PLADU|nr:lophotrochin [Platynereis dumerilii]
MAMDPQRFEQLLQALNQETHSTEAKKEMLFRSRGSFTAHQASSIIYAFPNSSDKVHVMQILETKLSPMTCSEAKDILGSFPFHNDKVTALQSVKRVLVDSQSDFGVENLLSAFPYEHDKQRAFGVLRTARTSVHNKVAAGGHQGYAALGGLYTQSRPLVPHLYGRVEAQGVKNMGISNDDMPLPVTARPNTAPFLYTSYPSHSFRRGRDYATDRQYPGNVVPNFYLDYPVTGLERSYGNPTAVGNQTHVFTGY